MNSGKKDFKMGDVWLDGLGYKVTIIKTDLKGNFTIVGTRLSSGMEVEEVRTYKADGTFSDSSLTRKHDLVKKYEPPVGPEVVYIEVRKSDGWFEPATSTPPESYNDLWAVVKYRRVDEE